MFIVKLLLGKSVGREETYGDLERLCVCKQKIEEKEGNRKERGNGRGRWREGRGERKEREREGRR